MAKNRQYIITSNYSPRVPQYTSSYTWNSTTTTTTKLNSTANNHPVDTNYDSYKYSRSNDNYSFNNNIKTTTATKNNIVDKSDVVYEKFNQDKDFLPVNRSSNLGTYFNGTNFGLLSK